MTSIPPLDPQAASTVKRKVDRLLIHFGKDHQHPLNELIHLVGIPLIMFGLMGMMFTLHPYVAYAFIAASMGFYARLSVVFLLAMALWSSVTMALVILIGAKLLPLSVAVFIGAWALLFIGHKMEGRMPSLFEDIQFLWVGPMFVLSKLFRRLGIRW